MALIPLFPTPESAAGRAGVETGLMYDRLGESEMRRMQGMGINPASARFNGLRQALALKKAAAVSGAKTRAANQARESAFSRIMQLAALGQRGLLLPQTATRVPGTGSNTVGRGSGLVRPIGMGLAAWNNLNQPPAPQAPAKPAAQPAQPPQPPQSAQPQPAAPVAAQTKPTLIPTAPAAPRPVLRPPARPSAGTGIFLGGVEQSRDSRAPGVYLPGGMPFNYVPENVPASSPVGQSMPQSPSDILTKPEDRPSYEDAEMPEWWKREGVAVAERDRPSLIGSDNDTFRW